MDMKEIQKSTYAACIVDAAVPPTADTCVPRRWQGGTADGRGAPPMAGGTPRRLMVSWDTAAPVVRAVSPYHLMPVSLMSKLMTGNLRK